MSLKDKNIFSDTVYFVDDIFVFTIFSILTEVPFPVVSVTLCEKWANLIVSFTFPVPLDQEELWH